MIPEVIHKQMSKKKDDLSRSRIPINATDTHAHVCACACMYNFFSTQGRARIFCLGGPNFVTNILVSSQDKPSHSGINTHSQI